MLIDTTKQDFYETLQKTSRPIIVYGMGNGADKLLKVFETYNIQVQEFMASDTFVRGQSFHNKKVKSYKEIIGEYKEPIFVVAFASKNEDVITFLRAFSKVETVYIPDLPVVGDEVFDRAFFVKHESEFEEVYNYFTDETSKRIYRKILESKYFGTLYPLWDSYDELSDQYRDLDSYSIKKAIDCGAYTGDTFQELQTYASSLEEVWAIEPDEKSFKKLQKLEGTSKVTLHPIFGAVGSDVGEGYLNASANRNSNLMQNPSYEAKSQHVSVFSVDSIGENEKIDYIKYDVEGYEMQALEGSKATILSSHPRLLLSLYHKPEDLYLIPKYIHEHYPFYKMSLHRKKCLPAWEINLICKE